MDSFLEGRTLRLIGRIACMTEGGAPIGRALSFFRVLRWHDRSDILKGARQAYPVKFAQNNVTLLFFPDFSPATAIRRKAFGPVWRRWQHLVSSPSSSIQRWLSYGTKGEQRSFDSPQKAEDFISPCLSRSPMPPLFGGRRGEQRPLFLPVRREGRDGLDGLGPSCPEGDDSRMAMDAS